MSHGSASWWGDTHTELETWAYLVIKWVVPKVLSVHSLLLWVHLEECVGTVGMKEWSEEEGSSLCGGWDSEESNRITEIEDEVEKEEEDYGCSSETATRLPKMTSGTRRPITGALLISTQCALCQKSNTVRALWTSSPFKSTQRAFLWCELRGMWACNGLQLCVAIFVWGSEGSVIDY